jgi:hypothetical protein
MFKNGKTKSYKSKWASNTECEKVKEHYENYFKNIFRENIDGNFAVKNNFIRCSDISSIKISYTL